MPRQSSRGFGDPRCRRAVPVRPPFARDMWRRLVVGCCWCHQPTITKPTSQSLPRQTHQTHTHQPHPPSPPNTPKNKPTQKHNPPNPPTHHPPTHQRREGRKEEGKGRKREKKKKKKNGVLWLILSISRQKKKLENPGFRSVHALLLPARVARREGADSCPSKLVEEVRRRWRPQRSSRNRCWCPRPCTTLGFWLAWPFAPRGRRRSSRRPAAPRLRRAKAWCSAPSSLSESPHQRS